MKGFDLMSDKCTPFTGLLSSYVDGELGAEDTATVALHLQDCPQCASRISSVKALKSRLREAANAVPPAVGLETRIRARLREQDLKTVGWFTVPRLALSAVAVVALTVGGWAIAIQPMQRQIAAILGIGTGDHIHCTLQRNDVGTFTEDTSTEMPGLLAAVKENVPPSFKPLESHICGVDGRDFGHLVFENDGHKVSVIVTRKKDGESFPRATVLARMRAHGIPVYQVASEPHHLHTAGLDSGRYFAFVVSDMSAAGNQQLMAMIGPAIAETMR